MAGRDVEGLEVVIVRFDLGTLDGLEAHRAEDARHVADRGGPRPRAVREGLQILWSRHAILSTADPSLVRKRRKIQKPALVPVLSHSGRRRASAVPPDLPPTRGRWTLVGSAIGLRPDAL